MAEREEKSCVVGIEQVFQKRDKIEC